MHKSENKTELAETYIHLRSERLTLPDLEAYVDALRRISYECAQEIYGGGVEIRIRAKQDSITEWATVLGILGALLAGYPKIKLGARELTHDAIMFGTLVIEKFMKELGLSKSHDIVTLRRKKVPGQIGRFFRRLDKFQRERSTLSESIVKKEKGILERDFSSIMRGIEDKEGRDAIIREIGSQPVGRELQEQGNLLEPPLDTASQNMEVDLVPVQTTEGKREIIETVLLEADDASAKEAKKLLDSAKNKLKSIN